MLGTWERSRPKASPGTRSASRGVLLGWLLIALGSSGAWLSGQSTALRLSGPDLGEFVKFLPSVQDGTLHLNRPFFYLPAFAFSTSVALLAMSSRLRFTTLTRYLFLGLGALVSFQMLPPAWSPTSLRASEFRAQVVGIAVSWFLLAVSSLLGKLPLWLTGLLVGLASAASGVLAATQVRPLIPEVSVLYGNAAALGWGFWSTEAGLLVLTSASLLAAVQTSVGRRNARL